MTSRSAPISTIAACAAILALAPAATAQHVTRVKDINTSLTTGFTSYPAYYTDAGGGVAYFQAYEPAIGKELWRTDGTEAGTYLVKDINPGTSDSSPMSFTNVNGTMFFTADDPHGLGLLWKTDGTAAGTVLVKSNVSPSGPFGPSLTNVNGTLFFTAYQASTGTELWKSDGTAAGTVLVKDILPGTTTSSPQNLTAVGGLLYFTADDGVHGMELWKSDGTAAGTVLVKDIRPGSAASSPGRPMAYGPYVYFSADDGVAGRELWRTDGTEAGTTMVVDIRPGAAASGAGPIAVANGILFLLADDGSHGQELWKSDGTAAGTALVRDIAVGTTGSSIDTLAVLGNLLLFRANNVSNGYELWRSDGTTAGTFMVQDIWPGSSHGVFGDFIVIGNRMLFVAGNNGTGNEWWTTDGTSAGTTLVADILPGIAQPNITFPAKVGDQVIFGANDGVHGQEPWKTDGTAAGTVMIKDIYSGLGSRAQKLTAVGQTLFFIADDGAGFELWKSDGTQAGTTMVKDIVPPGGPFNPIDGLTKVGSRLFFSAWTSSAGSELWTSDGTAGGTVMVKDLCPGTCGAPVRLTDVDGTLFFVEAAGLGQELYKSDGTAAGTVLVKDINSGTASSSPDSLTRFKGQLVFSASDGSFGLWKSDGTTAGTVKLRSFSSVPTSLTVVNGETLYFAADDGINGVELWKSDGTAAGTVLVKNIRPSGSSSPTALAAVGNRLYFAADDGVHGSELWTTDGTAAGTVLVADIAAGPGSSSPQNLTDVLGTLFFSADDGLTGRELWKSDGTLVGTVLVEDIAPGLDASSPQALTNVNGTLFFAASDADGAEMWRSDGTATGTALVEDLDPGPAPSNPREFTPVFTATGVQLFFTAYTGADGGELRVMRNLRPLAAAGSDVTIREGESVTLDGSASSDPDGDPLAFEWRGPTGPPIALGAQVTVTPDQTTQYFLVVRDGFSGVSADSMTVTVLPTPDLSLTINGTDGGRGTVSVDPPGAVCDNVGSSPGFCAYSYDPFALVHLSAGALPDSVFVGWSGACTGTGPCDVTMDVAKSVTAQFRGPQALAVTADSFEGGSGTVYMSVADPSFNSICANSPGAPQTCANLFRVGTTVDLVAFPSPDSVFLSWSGACAGNSAPTCQVTMDQAKAAVAVFRGPQPLAVTADSFENGSGTVYISVANPPLNTTCANAPGAPQTCANLFRVGTTVDLVAFPSPDSVFLSWSGACAGTIAPTCQVTMDQAKAAVAVFRGPQPLAVTADSFENGSGTVYISVTNPPLNATCANTPGSPQTCANLFRVGTTVDLVAFPSPDSVFLSWSGACAGTIAPTCHVDMDQAKAAVAVFRGPQPLAVTADSFENGSGTVYISVTNPPLNSTCANTPGAPQTCANLFRVGTTVDLVAFPSPDSVFLSWSGACAGTIAPTCHVDMDQAKAAVAVFRGPQPLAVTADSFENGSGTVSISIVNSPWSSTCANTPGVPRTCANLFRAGTIVRLDPVASPDSVFVGWGGACTGSGLCEVTVTQATAVQATFRGPQVLTLRLVGTEGAQGRVDLAPLGGTCELNGAAERTCSSSYFLGTQVTLTATAPPGSVFVGWTGCAGTSTCVATMGNATTVTATFRINHVPVAAPGGPYSAVRSAAVTFNATGSSDADGDLLTYAWEFGDGTTGSGPNPTHAYAALGLYTATLTVSDGQASSTPVGVAVSIVNRPPVANAGGPYAAVRGQSIAFDPSGSSDADGDPLTYTWDFGDGMSGTGAASHAYSGLGTFTATLVAHDGHDPSAPAHATVTISNRPPVASIGGPYAGTHRIAVAFDASASSDADGDPLTFAWTFGDGSTGVGASPSHTYASDGTYTVAVVVSDGVDSHSASTTVSVIDTAPVARPGGPYSGFKNAPFVLDGGASSDGNGDALTYRWYFGDGSSGTGRTVSHTYGLPAGSSSHVYAATLIVSDGSQDSAPVSATVEVRDHAPVARAGGPYTANRNQAITLAGSSSSDEDGDALSYRWDFGDGSTGTGASPSHSYSAFGTYTVRLVVNDGYADSAEATALVSVADRPPVATAGGPYSGVRGQVLTLDGSASTDPDGNGLTYRWTFGDGGTGTAVRPTHAYTAVGTFTATLIVNDGALDSVAASATVTIANQPPVANAGGPYTGTRVQAVTFNGVASSDPDGDALTYAWTFGDGAAGTGAHPTHTYATLGTFTVTLTVNDGFTTSAPVTTTVTVSNVAPTANAGPDRTVPRRSAVTLDGGSSSDADGTITAWSWRQLSGPAVSLTGASTSVARFTAPNVSSTTVLTFELKVTDNNGATATDQVRVTVTR